MRMDNSMKLVCVKSFWKGFIPLTLVVLLTYSGTGNFVNSIEREVIEMTGTVSVTKSWLVFMDRRVLVCGQNENSMVSLFKFLRCLSKKANRKYKCIYWSWGNARCLIFERDGNVLHLKSLHSGKTLHLRVDVNRIYSLNVSFLTLHLSNSKKRRHNHLNYMDLQIGNKSERYIEDRLPWTIISKHTSAIISVNSVDSDLHIAFEYSIAEKSNHEFNSPHGTYNSYRNYLLLERFHIVVETIYRIHVEISGCFLCKIIAHDGPHEIFPTILRQRIGPRGFTSFSTSAHYSLVFMTSQTLWNTTVIRYNAMFVVYTTFTLGRPTQLVFDNNTRCNDNTDQVRSCVFKIYAPGDSNVKLTLTKIQVEGVYVGTDFAAGLVVYNVVGGQPEKVGELLWSDRYFPLHGVPFTCTESTMYVVIFAYSVCASIFAKALTTAERCKGIFVRMDRHPTTATVHFDNSTNIKCFRVQTVSLFHSKFISAKLSIHITPNITVLAYLGRVRFYRDRDSCPFNLFNNLQDTQPVKSEKKGYQSYFGNIRKLDWDCSPVTKIIITEIKTASCVLPCRLLLHNKGFAHNSFSCDLCRFKYLGGLWSTTIASYEINRTTLIDLRIYSSYCEKLDLVFRIDPTSSSKAITVDVRRNQTFNMASQLRVSMLYELRCMIRLPRHATSVKYYKYSKSQIMTEPLNFIWGEYLYRIMVSTLFLSWTHTARECQKYGGSLLVVRDQMEYYHIEHLMRTFAVGVLYIGWKHKVSQQLDGVSARKT